LEYEGATSKGTGRQGQIVWTPLLVSTTGFALWAFVRLPLQIIADQRGIGLDLRGDG